ncbi:MAG TPA: hypothetical protein VNY52_07740 [Solirubrobacteraceae bacterium]|jgi:hypothetical protein|nr:hypothetical protein [Solirubrobacteraceae bacterium]
MSKESRIDADLIERASESWLSARVADKAPGEWVSDLQIEWLSSGQFEYMCQFILRLCESVDPRDSEIIEYIGADPMLALFLWYPDQALKAIEDMADRHPIIIDALFSIARGTGSDQAHIEAILARHGRPLDPLEGE